jgi:hypothetical protein
MIKITRNKSKRNILEYYFIFSIYAIPVCGLIAIPGLFFHYWMVIIGHLCVAIAVLAVLSYALIFLYFALKKTTIEDNSVCFHEIGKLVVLSSHLFFNDSLTIKNAEKVDLQMNEYSIFILVGNHEQSGLLLLSTTNNPDSIKNILVNNNYKNSTILVDSGKLYVIADGLVITKPSDFVKTKYLDNEIVKFYETGCTYLYLSVKPIYGDGDYEIRHYDVTHDSLIALEMVPDSFEKILVLPWYLFDNIERV